MDGLQLFGQQSPLFYQDAQDTQCYEDVLREPEFASKLLRARARVTKKSNYIKHNHRRQQSYVIKEEPTNGRRLVKIQIIDISESRMDHKKKDVILAAQYVIKDDDDTIMDETEKLVNNISKKMCGYSYSF